MAKHTGITYTGDATKGIKVNIPAFEGKDFTSALADARANDKACYEPQHGKNGITFDLGNGHFVKVIAYTNVKAYDDSQDPKGAEKAALRAQMAALKAQLDALK